MLSTIFFAHSKTPISGVQLMGVSSQSEGFLPVVSAVAQTVLRSGLLPQHSLSNTPSANLPQQPSSPPHSLIEKSFNFFLKNLVCPQYMSHRNADSIPLKRIRYEI